MNELILQLMLQGYEVLFVLNPANNQYIGIRLSKDGYHVQGSVVIGKWSDDQACGAIAMIRATLDLRLKGKK